MVFVHFTGEKMQGVVVKPCSTISFQKSGFVHKVSLLFVFTIKSFSFLSFFLLLYFGGTGV
jgi:hypothetical protein